MLLQRKGRLERMGKRWWRRLERKRRLAWARGVLEASKEAGERFVKVKFEFHN